MIYVCPEKDRAVSKPCEPCICGMDKLPVFRESASDGGAKEHERRMKRAVNARMKAEGRDPLDGEDPF